MEFTPYFTPICSQLPQVPDLDVTKVSSEQVLKHRLVKKGSVAIVQVLVKWSGLPASSTTWVDFSVLKQKYPSAAA
jgi:hypothetical protein